jgi:hypothetical protein
MDGQIRRSMLEVRPNPLEGDTCRLGSIRPSNALHGVREVTPRN